MLLVLAEHAFVRDEHIEDAARALDELDPQIVTQRCLQLGDHTGRLRQVVSLHAVDDADVHDGNVSPAAAATMNPTDRAAQPTI